MRFIRKNGRVIPIRDKRESAKAIGIGVGVGAASGVVAAHLHRESAYTENVARNAAKKGKAIGEKMMKIRPGSAKYSQFKTDMNKAFKTSRLAAGEAKALHLAGSRVRATGAVLGSSLIGAGTHKLLDHTKLKENPTAQGTIATGAGIASHFALRSAYAKTLGSKGISTFQAVKHAAVRIMKRGFKL